MPDTPGKRPPWNEPFEEQLAFFKRKLNLPTERWDDIMRSAHDRAFIVAGAQSADLLQDLHGAVETAIKDGTGLEAFRKNFKTTVAKHGWSGWTGQGTEAGEAWRTKVIYQANMATSYAAGRWQQLNDPDLVAAKPYLQYRHRDGVMFPRPEHVALDGLTLPRNHHFWPKYYPPNGWGCHCYVIAVSKAEFMRATAAGRGVSAAPEPGDITGIDKGFDYAPGANATRPYQDFIGEKLINLNAPIGAEMWKVLEPVVKAEQQAMWQEMVNSVASKMQAHGQTMLAHVLSPATVADMTRLGVPLDDCAIWMRDHDLLHAIRDSKTEAGRALPLETWMNLPDLIAEAKPSFDALDPGLVYALGGDAGNGVEKLVVRVNLKEKVRIGDTRDRLRSNFIHTGGVVDQANLLEARYEPLRK